MRCTECDVEYIACDCGTAYWNGSSSAEHFMNCPLNGLGYQRGSFVPNDGELYPKWEAPSGAGLCPSCWHAKNPGKERTIPAPWVQEVMGEWNFG